MTSCGDRPYEMKAAETDRAALDTPQSGFIEQGADVSRIDMTVAVKAPKES